MTSPEDREGPLPPLLLVLTAVTGLVDAVSYLALGRVFVANMTGNVVFLGFAVVGAPDLSAGASLVAIATFMTGAVIGGRLGVHSSHRGRLLAVAIFIKIALVAIALIVAILGTQDEAQRYALIVLLALGMGIQNATARHLAVPDITTTVLTTTLTGLAADSALSGGRRQRAGRRAISALSMLAGAAIGALLVLYVSVAAALALALVVLVADALAVCRSWTSTATWTADA